MKFDSRKKNLMLSLLGNRTHAACTSKSDELVFFLSIISQGGKSLQIRMIEGPELVTRPAATNYIIIIIILGTCTCTKTLDVMTCIWSWEEDVHRLIWAQRNVYNVCYHFFLKNYRFGDQFRPLGFFFFNFLLLVLGGWSGRTPCRYSAVWMYGCVGGPSLTSDTPLHWRENSYKAPHDQYRYQRV